MKSILVSCILILVAAAPVHAQTVEELKQQLEAQKQINELLKQRIRTLEKQAADKRGDRAAMALSTAPEESQPVPDKAAGDPEENRALERALVRKGLSILPSGTWELTPGLVWSHSGSDAIHSRSDDYIATLDGRVGLPWDTMLGIGIPYYIESDREVGDNSGFGDLSLRGWKQFLAQGDSNPSLVGSLSYRAPTAEDTDGPVPLGSDFHRLRVNLNASKSIDPLVLYGDMFYSYAFSESFDGIKTQPGSYIGAHGGASLAITPEITGNIGLSFSFVDELEQDGVKLNGTEQTVGFLELGTGFLISKRYFLSLSADIGITDDAPDLVLGISLPTRF